jgi:hypothetical protein
VTVHYLQHMSTNNSISLPSILAAMYLTSMVFNYLKSSVAVKEKIIKDKAWRRKVCKNFTHDKVQTQHKNWARMWGASPTIKQETICKFKFTHHTWDLRFSRGDEVCVNALHCNAVVPPKSWYQLTNQYGVTTQKTNSDKFIYRFGKYKLKNEYYSNLYN